MSFCVQRDMSVHRVGDVPCRKCPCLVCCRTSAHVSMWCLMCLSLSTLLRSVRVRERVLLLDVAVVDFFSGHEVLMGNIYVF